MLPIHFVAGIIAFVVTVSLFRTADCRSKCYSKYLERFGKCKGRYKGLSSTISYRECCSKRGAQAWKSDTSGPVCIKCVNIVDGGWGNWKEWEPCSATCDYGISKRERKCDNPRPKHGGTECNGPKLEEKRCYAGIRCPIDGQWTRWVAWSTCSVSCKRGIRLRSRSCSNPRPKFGGKDCRGTSESSEDCMDNAECPIDGAWSVWLAWSYCDKDCGMGSQTRARVCNNPKPIHNGKDCKGSGNESSRCVITRKCNSPSIQSGSGDAVSGSGSASSGASVSGDYKVITPSDTEGSASGSGSTAPGIPVDVESGDASGAASGNNRRPSPTGNPLRTPASSGSQGGEDASGLSPDDEDSNAGSGSGSSAAGSAASSIHSSPEKFVVIKP